MGWGSRGGALTWGSESDIFSYSTKADLTITHMHADINPLQSWWGTHLGLKKGGRGGRRGSPHTQIQFGWKKKRMNNKKKAGTGNVSGNEKQEKIYSEALQASFILSNWQRWVRQLGFSSGPLWHSFHPPSLFLSGCPSTASVCCVLSFTPGQEVFGSSVVSCPECYQESSSDGQPTLPLSAAGLCRGREGGRGGGGEKNTNRWLSHKSRQTSHDLSWSTNFTFHQTLYQNGHRCVTLAITH